MSKRRHDRDHDREAEERRFADIEAAGNAKADTDVAPYPAEFTPEQRTIAYWYALKCNIHQTETDGWWTVLERAEAEVDKQRRIVLTERRNQSRTPEACGRCHQRVDPRTLDRRGICAACRLSEQEIASLHEDFAQ